MSYDSIVWKLVQGWNGYEVSNTGLVRCLLRFRAQPPPPRVINTHPDGRGYKMVWFYPVGNPKGRKPFRVHHLVAELFIGPRPEGYCINHINGDKLDNRLENLEYVTLSQNSTHAYRIGLQSKKGTRHHMAKLDENKVREIRRLRIEGVKCVEIAELMGVTQSCISRIASGELWSHIQ